MEKSRYVKTFLFFYILKDFWGFDVQKKMGHKCQDRGKTFHYTIFYVMAFG